MKEIQLQMKLPGVPKAKQGREVAPAMGMDRSKRVDRTHVGNPRKRNQRRQMVQSG